MNKDFYRRVLQRAAELHRQECGNSSYASRSVAHRMAHERDALREIRAESK